MPNLLEFLDRLPVPFASLQIPGKLYDDLMRFAISSDDLVDETADLAEPDMDGGVDEFAAIASFGAGTLVSRI